MTEYAYSIAANNSILEVQDRKKARRRAKRNARPGAPAVNRRELARKRRERRQARTKGARARYVGHRRDERPARERTEAYLREAIKVVEQQLEKARTWSRRRVLRLRLEDLRAELGGIA